MRPSRSAALAASLLVLPVLAGCGGGAAPGGAFGDDRDEIVRVLRANATAEAQDDARTLCGLMTTGTQRSYLDRGAGRAGQGPRDTAACTTAYARVLRQVYPGADGRKLADLIRNEEDRVRRAVRDEGRIAITFRGDEADVVVDTAPGDDEDTPFLLEREDGRWRMSRYPETATLR